MEVDAGGITGGLPGAWSAKCVRIDTESEELSIRSFIPPMGRVELASGCKVTDRSEEDNSCGSTLSPIEDPDSSVVQ